MKRGLFITFEGPEKSGKSTQAGLLSGYLKGLGFKTIFVREPGSTGIGEKIRGILLDIKHTEMSEMTEMFLYMAARAQLVSEVITPALKKGYIVLCDRFLDSTLAYQGYGCGLDKDVIIKAGRWATSGLEPDLTLLLDFWASSANLKNHKSPDRIEMRPSAFHQKVRRGYFQLAKKQPRRIKVVQVERTKEQTQAKIREIVSTCLLKISSAKTAPSRY
ncbi:MAG: dTMP kinase [Candidatus Omnitrophica bacterium]|nr:dTMP kinase [Candidatus Omnitrophota bacterium]